jgi:4-amino-4-deoxy-L-arabinose transferase-like glycosyltransferase
MFVSSLVAFFILASWLQLQAGAYSAELSGYPDEAAHFTTGLMLRDYAANGFPGNAMQYAENFYLHYPKVAIGHWPPLFHILEALWLLIFPVSRGSVMALMALYCAVIAALIATWVSARYGRATGYLTGALFVCLPLTQKQTAMVMAEGLLTIFALLAARSYARYLETGEWRPAMLFGIFATFCILVKGNGWALALLPPFAVLLTRRFHLVKRWEFWLPALVVLLFCAPWQIMTAHLVQQGWTGDAGLAYAAEAFVSFGRGLWVELGPAVSILVLAGIASEVSNRRGASPRAGSMLALFLAFYVFHVLTPAGIEIRQILAGIAALLTFAPVGVISISRFLRSRRFVMLSRPAVLAVVAGLFFAGETFAIPPKLSYGFEQTAAYLDSRPELKQAVVLSSSEAMGEGMMITETEMRERRPGHYILRASKLLAVEDWSGRKYQALFPSAAAVRNELNLIPVGVLVIDFTPGETRPIHHTQLLSMLAAHPPEWKLAGSFGPGGGVTRPVRLYVRTHGALAPGEHLKSVLADELHRIEEQ